MSEFEVEEIDTSEISERDLKQKEQELYNVLSLPSLLIIDWLK